MANTLQPQFGSGFSRRQLYWYVQFYRTFPIVSAVRSQFNWTHYKTLIRLDNSDKREFYLAEATKNNWSAQRGKPENLMEPGPADTSGYLTSYQQQAPKVIQYF